jgi:hypothetical protein
VEEKVLTQYPDPGKSGINISKQKYDVIREAILESIRVHGEVTFTELMQVVQKSLEDKFEGSILWYVTTVKLDLGARGLIERVPGSRPQQLRLVGGSD